jgi:hypothetical protein
LPAIVIVLTVRVDARNTLTVPTNCVASRLRARGEEVTYITGCALWRRKLKLVVAVARIGRVQERAGDGLKKKKEKITYIYGR